MISRSEFYSCMAILICVFVFTRAYYDKKSDQDEIEKQKLQTMNSIYQVQRDSAISSAMQHELRSDSLQSVINRRNLDINSIRKKYENEKKNVLVLGADSTLSLFERSVAH